MLKNIEEQKLRPNDTTQADVVADIGWWNEVAIGATRVGGVVVPISPTDNTSGPGCRSLWIAASCVGSSVPVPTKALHIASQIVKSITVGRKGADRAGVRLRWCIEDRVIAGRTQVEAKFANISVIVGLVFGDGIAPRKPQAGQPASRRLLPLS